MSVIKMNNLGGLAPSVSARALPDNGAQKANNLFAGTAEFRPLQTDVAVAVSAVTNPKTLYRVARDANGAFTADMTQNWTVSAAEVNYTKGQVNDSAKERTYYTYADGSAPPRVMDSTGADKLLGVPPPATAPTGTVNVVYSYTPEARAAELTAARNAAVDIIRKNVIVAWQGATFGTDTNGVPLLHPGKTTAGYMDLYDPTHPYNPDHAKVFRIFQVSAPNTAVVVNSFTSALLTAQANPGPVVAGITPYLGVFDPRLGGVFSSSNGQYGGTNWIADAKPVFAVPFYAYGRVYDFDQPTIVNLFRAIKMPGTNGAIPLFADELSNAFLTQLKAVASPSGSRIKPLIESLAGACEQFHNIMDTGQLQTIGYVVDKQAELKGLSEAIGDEYTKINDELPSMFDQFFTVNNLDVYIPPGTNRIIEDRFYIVTYVTAWGEESAPSPVSGMAELDQNDTVTGAAPNPPAGYGITKYRYYRTNTGSTGAAFQFVGEATFTAASLAGNGATTVLDDKKAAELGEVCPTLTWQPPPFRMDSAGLPKGANPYLRGMVDLANGIMAGFFDNTVAFCESYIPYAWPIEYQITTSFPIVALGAFGQTAVIFHNGGVDFATGSHAASMSHDKNVSLYACVSRRSIANSRDGVIYASSQGICIASRAGVQLLTVNLWTLEDWRKLIPSSIVGAIHDATYYFTFNNGTPGCYALHVDSGKLITLDVTGSTLYTDILTDRLYTVQGNSIQALFAGTTHRTGTYRCKVTVLPLQTAFAWLTIESDFEAPVTVLWYGDGVLRFTVAVTSRAPVRLPAGKYLEHEIEVQSAARWTSLTMASSIDELKQV